jgi:acetyl esterase/lipase
VAFSINKKIVGAFVALVSLTGCSPLGFFNAVVPFDQGSKRVAQDITYGQYDRQKLDIYAPVDVATDATLPTIVFFYGGSWKTGQKDRYEFAGRALAALGAVVVVADYRLVPDVHFPGFIQDGAAAIAWTIDEIAHYGGDPNRVFVAGHSAGAYNALLLGLDTHYLKDAGVDPSHIVGLIGVSGPYDFDPEKYAVTRDAFAGSMDDPDVSPLNFVDGDTPPVLLFHGEADTTVLPKNTRALAAALKKANRPVETHFYPDLSHADTVLAFSTLLRSKAPILDEIQAFIQRH